MSNYATDTMDCLPNEVLRKYDIRGKVGKNITPKMAYDLGRRFGQVLIDSGGKTCLIGYDGRLSSPGLQERLIQGLNYQGVDVINIGLCPTPMVSFAHIDMKTDAAIMVTGSHNPPNHNGFKITLKKEPFFDGAIQNLNKIVPEKTKKQGSYTTVDVLSEYVDRLLLRKERIKPFKVVWDAGHGAAGAVLPSLVKCLPGEHIMLYERVDGTFPAHHPDPTVVENMQDLVNTVLDSGADVGFAFDGDADRLGVVDDRGRIFWADMYMILLAQDILLKQPGAPVIADIKASNILFDYINALGGVAVISPTGHSIIKQKLKERQAPLAGEMSGHIFIADEYYGYDDGLYAAVRFLEAMSSLPGPLSSWFDGLPVSYATPELRFDCPVNKDQLLDDLKAKVCSLSDEYVEILDIDGLRVNVKGKGWWLLRASNTQDILVARCEGTSEKNLETMVNQLNELLRPYSMSLPV